MREFAWILAVAGLMPSMVSGQSYTWVGSPGTAWTGSGNWSPSGIPDGAGESALFDSSTTHDCTLSSSVSPDSVTFAQGYPGKLTVAIPSGLLTTANLSLTSGTLTSTLPDRVRVTSTLNITGGSVTDISCAGAATIDGGSITSLRLNGASGTLTSSGLVPVIVVTMSVPSGHTTQTRNFIPGLFSLSAPATYEVGNLSTLTLAVHSIQGKVVLDAGSLLTFTTGATIGGTIDASTSGSLVLCNGNWACTGTFVRAGQTTNGIVINQSTGGTINHGSNMADLVTIRGADGMVSDWTSANTVGSLSVLTSTTLRLATGKRLDVEGGIANLGTVDLSLGGVLGHPGDVAFVTGTGLAATSFVVGDPLRIRLTDLSNNLQGGVVETIGGLRLTNLTNGDVLDVSATENAVATGVFDASGIATGAGSAAADGVLQASGGDVIRVAYTDPNDATDHLAFAEIAATSAPLRAAGWMLY